MKQKDRNSQTEQELSTSLKIKIQEAKIVYKTIQEQNQIGWNQILRGRLGQYWEILAQTHQRQNNHNSWTTGLIKQLLQMSQNIWKYRLEKEFGLDKNSKEQYLQQILKPRIEEAYKNTKRNTPYHERLLSISIA